MYNHVVLALDDIRGVNSRPAKTYMTVDVIFITNTQNARVAVVVDVFAGPTYHVKARGSGC